MAPKTIKQAIKVALENLSKLDLKKFRSQLLDRREPPRIPRSKIEDKDVLEITDVLVSTFCESVALKVALEVLGDIDCNQDRSKLESVAKSIGQVPEPGSYDASANKSCTDKGEPTFRKTSTGELETKPAEEAWKYAARRCPLRERPPQKKPEEVVAEAKARVLSEGRDPSDDWLVLSRCTVQFGKYRGQTFKWLLENDVGYVAYLVASHEKELESTKSQNKLMANKENKDSLTRYANAYPGFLKVKALHLAQDGEARVGFGAHAKKTLKNLYESEDPKMISYVNFLRNQKSTCTPGSKMEVAVEYVLWRDQRFAAARTNRPTTSGAPQGPPKLVAKRKWVQSTRAASRSKWRKQK